MERYNLAIVSQRISAPLPLRSFKYWNVIAMCKMDATGPSLEVKGRGRFVGAVEEKVVEIY